MFFLASFIYVVVFPLLAMFFPVAAKAMPFIPDTAALALLHLGFYFLLVTVFRLSRFFWEDLDVGRGAARQLRAWLDVRGCQWLNLAGLIMVGVFTGILFLSGLLPYQNWFLCGATILGLHDLWKGNGALPLPTDLPKPRIDCEPMTEISESSGKRCEFSWKTWSAELREISCQQSFIISHADYQQAQTLQRPAQAEPEAFLQYVRKGDCQSLSQCVAFFRSDSQKHGLTSTQEMENVVCFVSSIPVTSENRDSSQRTRFPVETLYDQAGSVEEHAILAAAILFYLGHDVALFFLRLTDGFCVGLGYRAGDLQGPFSRRSQQGTEYVFIETQPEANFSFLNKLQEATVEQIA